MEDFATIDELAAFWRPMTDEDEETRATSLLHMASNYLRQIAKNNNVDIDAKVDEDDVYKDTVKLAVLESVKRAMTTPTDAPAADQWSQSANPYSETIRFTNPSSNLFFKNNELQLLGFPSLSGKSKISILRGVR